jgi:hypothetical protein
VTEDVDGNLYGTIKTTLISGDIDLLARVCQADRSASVTKSTVIRQSVMDMSFISLCKHCIAQTFKYICSLHEH